MKAGTTEKIKFLRLQRRLSETRRGLVGLLELLWHATARDAPRGDIGRFDNEAIAIMCDWEGDPDELVEALASTGWLDAHPQFRLVVHDWAEHCPTYIKGGLAKKGLKPIATSSEVQAIATSSEVEADVVPACSSEVSSTKPSQAKPNLTKPRKNNECVFSYSEEFESFWDSFPRVRRGNKGAAFKAWKKLRTSDHERVIAQAAAYAESDVGKSEFAQMASTWLNQAGYDSEPADWLDPKSKSASRNDYIPY